jgi:hypothetical protein
MKIKAVLKWTLLPLLGVLVSGFGVVLFFVITLWYQNSYKTELQTIEVPEQSIKFVLLTDMSGFDDTSWYVYKIGIDSKLSKAQKKSGETDHVLFWNYSEAGEHQENPYIRFIKGKYLIFSRGNLDYSLYDLAQDKVIVNEHSAWAAVVAKPDIDLPMNELNQLMNEWVLVNLHNNINNYIK